MSIPKRFESDFNLFGQSFSNYRTRLKLCRGQIKLAGWLWRQSTVQVNSWGRSLECTSHFQRKVRQNRHLQWSRRPVLQLHVHFLRSRMVSWIDSNNLGFFNFTFFQRFVSSPRNGHISPGETERLGFNLYFETDGGVPEVVSLMVNGAEMCR